jgi:signal transduction histidine kinase
LECRFGVDGVIVEMDPTAMRIALTNLLDNALDACEIFRLKSSSD